MKFVRSDNLALFSTQLCRWLNLNCFCCAFVVAAAAPLSASASGRAPPATDDDFPFCERKFSLLFAQIVFVARSQP